MWRLAGIPLGETRIGINTGTVVVGNFGGDSMFDYTAHGDAINIAARLESLNKNLGTRIAVSERTVDRIPAFSGRPAGRFILQGKLEDVEVLAPLATDEADSSAVNAYTAAYRMLDSGQPGAESAFAKLTESPQPDPLAVFHLQRIRCGESGTTVTMMEK